ncbi:MAG: hemolysin III family protein [Clostridia bacterium]|nr:hemolysin III family protein [Clostridia bacterium]
MRTKLRDRILPTYTKGEEIFNMVSHIVGGAFAVTALVLCVVVSALKGSVYGVVTSSVYGATMILLYCMSSIYHGLRPGIGKKVLQILDHCTIYLLIAGTYTPILLCAMRPVYPAIAWTVFGIEWGCAALAITLTAIDLKQYRVFSMICYIVMGWAIIFAIVPTLKVLTLTGFLYVLGGGILYTIGAVLYGLGKKRRYMHNAFHVFVIGGSVLQFLGIIFYAL